MARKGKPGAFGIKSSSMLESGQGRWLGRGSRRFSIVDRDAAHMIEAAMKA